MPSLALRVTDVISDAQTELLFHGIRHQLLQMTQASQIDFRLNPSLLRHLRNLWPLLPVGSGFLAADDADFAD